jgi:hypothetical protein
MIERGSQTRRSVVLPSHLAVRDSTGPSRLADPAS